MKVPAALRAALAHAPPRPTPLRAALAVPRPASLASSSRPPPASAQHRLLSSSPPTRATATSQSIYTAGASCPSCGTPIPPTLTPLCPSCASLLPPPPPATTYFALFGLEPTFAVDAGTLKRSFLQLQQKVHPDMYSGKGEVEDWAKAWSGKVNDAYKVLLNERERGEYLVRPLSPGLSNHVSVALTTCSSPPPPPPPPHSHSRAALPARCDDRRGRPSHGSRAAHVHHGGARGARGGDERGRGGTDQAAQQGCVPLSPPARSLAPMTTS